jgi:hypothetical protein
MCNPVLIPVRATTCWSSPDQDENRRQARGRIGTHEPAVAGSANPCGAFACHWQGARLG